MTEMELSMTKKSRKNRTIAVPIELHDKLKKMKKGDEFWGDFLERLADGYDGSIMSESLKIFLSRLVIEVHKLDDHQAQSWKIEDIGKDLIIDMLQERLS